jgi:site-specific DNA-methyltransferase (adenine-specific)
MTGDVTLLLGDCLDRMAEIADGSVDAIVTDPPYGQTNEGYDGPIAFSAELWRECFRVARPDAALISFAGSPTYHKIATAVEAGGWKVRQMWGWVYRDGMITSAYPKEGFDRLAPAMDPICYATKGKVLLKLEREDGPEWERGRYGCGYSARSDGNTYATRAAGHWPRSIASDGCEPFEYFVLSRAGRKMDATGHPNQKPFALMRWLVSKLPAGSLVLDPFAGSFTTAVACLDEGMRYIGIEQNPEYLEMGRARIAAHRASTPLFAEVPA